MNGERTNTSCVKCKYLSDANNCVWGIIRLHEIDSVESYGLIILRAEKCKHFEIKRE
jgi:hypothetical protein